MIELNNVEKRYARDVLALDRVSMTVKKAETVALIGPSGSGKTTTLKLINRLVGFDGGDVLVNGRSVREWDPIVLRRQIGYVIQDVGLLPHLTIAENVGMVPRLLGWRRARIVERVTEMLTLVGLEPETYARRHPSALSGGQQQRVGVARALAADPDILLMDEPFSALDPITRDTLQQEFRDLQSRLRKTVILVTHDLLEGLRLSDRVVIMRQGRIERVGTPTEILDEPGSDFLERFLGRHRELLRAQLAAEEQ